MTHRLIEKQSSSLIAVELNWSDATSINREILGGQSGAHIGAGGEEPFSRFPVDVEERRRARIPEVDEAS